MRPGHNFSWLAEEFGEKAPISEEMSAKIDAEISKLLIVLIRRQKNY